MSHVFAGMQIIPISAILSGPVGEQAVSTMLRVQIPSTQHIFVDIVFSELIRQMTLS